MARQEKDREDLMAEARNLVERCELKLPGRDESIIAGFRRDGRLSLYFGPDPVYHFDLSGRIRRAFVADKLYRGEKGRLVQLTRVRAPAAVYLYRHDMTDDETAAFLEEAQRHLSDLDQALETGQRLLFREIPPGADVVGRLHRFLATLRGKPLTLAPDPRSV